MTTYTGTQNVDPGLYLNTGKFSITTMDKPGPLPGADTDRYRRVPLLLMLAAAPLLGLAYVIFLPFIGFVAVAWLAGGKALEGVAAVRAQMGRVRRPAWAPALAFFSRSKPAAPTAPTDSAPAPDAWADEAERKLNEAERDA